MQDRILRNFRKVVTHQFISDVARKVKFNQRSTAQINGFDFASMLIMQIGSGRELNYSNLNATLSKINSKINISNQALSEYFYKKASVALVKSIYEKVFLFQKEMLMQKYNDNLNEKILNFFGRVLIEDSTICILNEQLQGEYRGAGGASSKSSLKIDVIQELKSAAIIKLAIYQGNVPDASLVSSILEELLPNDLVLRDLGYFKIEEFKNISDKNAYFISRFRSDIEVYLNTKNSSPIDLGKYLKKTYDDYPTQLVDFVVYLGRAKQEARIIAYKVPPEISNERRRKANENARRKGRTPSENHLNLCDYVILITNISKNAISGEVIGTIYRIRWTIELVFKTWKSELNLQVNLKGHKVTRIECFVYGTLIICLLTTLILGWLKKVIDPLEKEVSLNKLSKWLMNKQGYIRLFWGKISKLEEEIQKDLRKVKTQKRKRKTTLERVFFSEGYSEKYAVNF